MRKNGFFIFTLAFLSLVSADADAQRGVSSSAGPATRGGQNLSTMGAAPPTPTHAAEGFAAERLARARRQAQFSRDYSGTPLRPLAEASRIPDAGGGWNGAR